VPHLSVSSLVAAQAAPGLQRATPRKKRVTTTKKRKAKRTARATTRITTTVATTTSTTASAATTTTTTAVPTTIGVTPIPTNTTAAATTTTTVVLPTPAEYLERALAFIERYSVRRRTIDIRAITDKARLAGANAASIPELYPILKQATKDLGDRHSQFLEPNLARSLTQGTSTGFGLKIYPPDVIWVTAGSPAELAGIRTLDRIVAFNGKKWSQTTTADRNVETAVVRVNRAATGEFDVTMTRGVITTNETPQVRALDSRLGYMDLPGSTGKKEAEQNFSAVGAAGVASVEQQIRPCGWVVDLRRNAGGFPFSMMSPLEPFLPEQVVGGFVYGDDKRELLRFRNGEVVVGERVLWTNPTPTRLADPNVPVAVLTSNSTGSAGEIATLAFYGRPNSRIFGARTVGVTSANVGVTLPDGSFLMVTHSYDLDRTGKVYDAPLQPDEAIPVDWGSFGTPADPVLNRAKQWLGEQPACAGRLP
jgi:carboxyl-terminal processing protease